MQGTSSKSKNLLINLKRTNWQNTHKKTAKNHFFWNQSDKPLSSYRALLRIRSHWKTIFKNFATANTTFSILRPLTKRQHKSWIFDVTPSKKTSVGWQQPIKRTLTIRAHSKTVLKNFASANTPNKISKNVRQLQKTTQNDFSTSQPLKTNLCARKEHS